MGNYTENHRGGRLQGVKNEYHVHPGQWWCSQVYLWSDKTQVTVTLHKRKPKYEDARGLFLRINATAKLPLEGAWCVLVETRHGLEVV